MRPKNWQQKAIGFTVLVLVLSALGIVVGRYIMKERYIRGLQEQMRRLDQMAKEVASVEVTYAPKERVARIEKAVASLTTQEVVDRLSKLDDQINTLTKRVESLQQIISPETVSDILAIGKMKQEIHARREFENGTRERLKEFGTRIERTDYKLWNIQLWIWGTLVAVILLLPGGAVYIVRRLERTPKEGVAGGGAS